MSWPLFQSRAIVQRATCLAGALAIITAMFAAPALADEPKHGGTLVFGVESEIPWYDPHIVFGGSAKRVVLQIFEGLVDRDRSQPNVVPPLAPKLATSWDVSGDGKVYTFHLRDDVVFHDGTPFNAEAVVFNIRRVKDPDFEHYKDGTDSLANGPYRYVDTVRAVDEHTVEITLSQPWGHFVDQLSTLLPSGLPLMLSPASVEKWGNEDVNLHPVGTGPFKMESYEPGVKTVVVRNQDYWNKPLPYVDGIISFVVAEETTRITALEAGEVDMITMLPPDSIEQLRQQGFEITMPESMNLVWFLSINQNESHTKDVRVRQAINYAIDREKMAKELLKDTAGPVWKMVPGTSALFDTSERPYAYDPAKAKALLAEAGYADGFKLAGQFPSGGSYMIAPVQMAQWIQRDLAAVGIEMEIQSFDWVTYLGYWIGGLEDNVAFNNMAWGTDYSEFWAVDVMSSTAFGNTGHIKDPQLDTWFTEYQEAANQEEALAIADRIFDRVSDQAYFVPIVTDRVPLAYAPKVKGVVAVPDFMQVFDRVWIDE